MTLNENPTYYDLLELSPDASPQEVRVAYLRAKTAYSRDSVALYTLITPEETESLLRRIEEAYQVLSNPERRREYDRRYGMLTVDAEFDTPPRTPPPGLPGNVVSIDRVPPMEASTDQDLLVPPSTDFTSSNPADLQHASPRDLPRATKPAYTTKTVTANTPHGAPLGSGVPVGDEIAGEIATETEWHGDFIRRIREARRVSLEELAEFTKITKSYISAIEEENFNRLPAPVYLRGFLTQISKALKLPHEKVVGAYMARFPR